MPPDRSPRVDTSTQLRRSLGLPTLIGQSVASIGLTATAVISIPAIFLISGSSTWMIFVLATVLILLVAFTINLFARRVSGSGALADYVAAGLGEKAGLIAGWVLVLTYASNVVCLVGAFADNAIAFLAAFGLPQAVWIAPAAFVVCALLCLLLARREVHGSAVLMLVTEFLSVTVILILCGFILYRHDFVFDVSQLAFHLPPFSQVQAALLLAVLSFAGFESVTALANESNEPLRAIPRALIFSVVLAGAFFVFAAYVITLGLKAAPASVAQADNALEQLALLLRLPRASHFIALGGCICFFGACLASLTALARILLALANRGFLPRALGRVHERYHTPSVALFWGAVVGLVGALIFLANGVNPRDIFEYMGTFAVCGFLTIYFLVAVAAPFYLKKTGGLTSGAVLLSLVTSLAIAAFGFASVYPPQSGAFGLIPWVFMSLVVCGVLRVLLAR